MDDDNLPFALKQMSTFDPRLFIRGGATGGVGSFRIKTLRFPSIVFLMKLKFYRQ